jgi:hypothetical protein
VKGAAQGMEAPFNKIGQDATREGRFVLES